MDSPRFSHTFAIERHASCYRAAALKEQGGKIQLEGLYEAQDEPFPSLWNHIADKSLVITSLATSHVLVRPFEIKLTKSADIESALPFQLEPLLPYPLEQAVIDYIIVNRDAASSVLTILTTRHKQVEHEIKKTQEQGIEPEIVTATPIALNGFASLYLKHIETPFVILHISSEETTAAVIEQGSLIGAQAFTQGLKHLLESTKLNSLEEIDWTHPPPSLELWQSGALRLLYAINKYARGNEIKQCFVCGEGALFPHLYQSVLEKKNLTEILLNEEFPFPLPQILSCAHSIGAAATGLPRGPSAINFRKGDLRYPHPWKRYKKPLAFYFGLCLLLSLSLVIFGIYYSEHQASLLRNSYSTLLKLIRADHETFEKTFIKLPEEQVSDFASLDNDQIVKRVALINKTLSESPNLYPLFPNVPRVSDLLAWLSTHPAAQAVGDAPPLRLESFHYSFIKRPDPTHPQERYQIKVELDFKTPSSIQARAFYDALSAPNDWVDPKQEVKWNAGQGTYRITFYLKDKTIYPKNPKR